MPTRRIRSDLRKTLIRQDKALRQELHDEMQTTAVDMANWLTIATRGWTKVKVRFAPRVETLPDRLRAFADVAGTGKKIFGYIDKGTGLYGPKKKAYEIKPKPPNKVLSFRTGYKPKTGPSARINIGPGKATGKRVVAMKVIHPGIQPRDFTKVVSKELKPSFDQRIDKAIRRAIKSVR